MSDYEKELSRFLAEWDLQTRDAEIAENTQRLAEEGAVKKVMAIFVEQLGYSQEEALQRIKSTGRFPTYFADQSHLMTHYPEPLLESARKRRLEWLIRCRLRLEMCSFSTARAIPRTRLGPFRRWVSKH
jgi:hypothetical protein